MVKKLSSLVILLPETKNKIKTSHFYKKKHLKFKSRYSKKKFFHRNKVNNNSNHKSFSFDKIFNIKIDREKPVWMKAETQKIQNIDERFDNEIIEYVNYIIPKNLSLIQRQNTISTLKNIIEKYKPNWKVYLYGSFSQNTSTIFSDLDFAILDNKNDNSSNRRIDIGELIYLLEILNDEKFGKNIRIIIKARVPVLKATCSLTNINIDISMNRLNGYQSASIIRKVLEKHKMLRPIIIILKILLRTYHLNDASTGGMSSFLLFHLVYFFYIQYQKEVKKANCKDEEDEIENEKNENNFFSDLFENNGNNENEDEVGLFNYDSNNLSKNLNDNYKLNFTKAFLSTDEGDKFNTDNSYLIKNWISSNKPNMNNKKNIKLNKNDFENEDSGKKNNTINFIKKDEINIQDNKNIGIFLILFLKFYSFDFDYENLGFSVNESNFGCTFYKAERKDMECSETICAESIQERGVDVGRNCYNYKKVINAFKNAYDKIRNEKMKNACSILQSLGFPSI